MPVSRHQVYKCLVCGIVTEVREAGAGEPVCCGQKMVLATANVGDGDPDEHLPQVRREGSTVHVRVGRRDHPTDRRHYIQWIELLEPGGARQVYLGPGDAPEASFPSAADGTCVRAFCLLHGLWEARA